MQQTVRLSDWRPCLLSVSQLLSAAAYRRVENLSREKGLTDDVDKKNKNLTQLKRVEILACVTKTA